MRSLPTIAGALVAFSALVAVVWVNNGDLVQAVVARQGLVPESGGEFYPTVTPAAEALIRSARVGLARLADEGLLADVTTESLEREHPALSRLDAGPWFLSLYEPGDRDRYGWVHSVRVDGDAGAALRDLWTQLPIAWRQPESIARGRLKVDRWVGPERPFPYDGGFKGVALDKGLDGIVLRHPENDPFFALPSWFVEGETRTKSGGKWKYNGLRRSGMHPRARRLAREMADWRASETKEASFAAFRTQAWIEDRPGGGGAVVAVTRGNVQEGAITPELLRERIRLAGDYMKRETDDDGRITYDYKAFWDEVKRAYNILRHAGTTYSMLQGFRLHRDPELLAAAKRAVDFYVERMREDGDNPGEWFVVWKKRRAKLGGVGLGLCMMVELEKAAPGSADLALVEGMARHIERMQNPDGSFESFFAYDDRKPTNRKSIYYSGEVILGLVRLHQLTSDPRWLDIAVRGADYLVHRRWVSLGLRIYVPPDAWLLQALEEMDRVAPDSDRVDYAFAIASTIARHKMTDPETSPPDFLGGDVSGLQRLPNSAGAGAFGEALSAAARLEARHRPGQSRYRQVAMLNAGFQLRNQFTEANSYYLPNPARALGGFRRNPDYSEIRNDHVQHNLSGLFGLLDLLDPTAPDIGWLVPAEQRPAWPPGSGRGTAPAGAAGSP